MQDHSRVTSSLSESLRLLLSKGKVKRAEVVARSYIGYNRLKLDPASLWHEMEAVSRDLVSRQDARRPPNITASSACLCSEPASCTLSPTSLATAISCYVVFSDMVPFIDLPNEVWEKIISSLTQAEKLKMYFVCKKLKFIAENSRLWREITIGNIFNIFKY